ncbi:MAG: hypothetical protein ACRD1L_04880 [Terriglobales bacterium]
MHKTPRRHLREPALISAFLLASLALLAWHWYAYGQDKSQFPDGFDAVQAAPNSHKVIFENALVRVLDVTVPPAGTTEPMHHHRWPSFFLDWDTGGCTAHVRYHRGDGTVTDQPSRCTPIHPGAWNVKWMQPEPMHAIEVADNPGAAAYAAGKPPLLRIEIKFHP